MKYKNIPITVATCFFLLWLGILLAGADHPPPTGFIWVVIMDQAVAIIVYFRSRTYLKWLAEGKRFCTARATRDGLAAGALVALIMSLGPGGEPSVQPTWIDHLILLAVVGILGAINAPLVYWIVTLLGRKAKRKEDV